MSIGISRGKNDKILAKITGALAEYQKDNSKAKIDLYRRSPVSVRIRIVDPSFRGLDKSSRHDKVWKFLEHLPEETQSDISMLVLLAPGEEQSSFSNMEFEDPVPSKL